MKKTAIYRKEVYIYLLLFLINPFTKIAASQEAEYELKSYIEKKLIDFFSMRRKQKNKKHIESLEKGFARQLVALFDKKYNVKSLQAILGNLKPMEKDKTLFSSLQWAYIEGCEEESKEIKNNFSIDGGKNLLGMFNQWRIKNKLSVSIGSQLSDKVLKLIETPQATINKATLKNDDFFQKIAFVPKDKDVFFLHLLQWSYHLLKKQNESKNSLKPPIPSKIDKSVEGFEDMSKNNKEITSDKAKKVSSEASSNQAPLKEKSEKEKKKEETVPLGNKASSKEAPSKEKSEKEKKKEETVPLGNKASSKEAPSKEKSEKEKKKEDTVPLGNKASSKEAPSKEKSEKEKKKEDTVPLGNKASSKEAPSKEKSEKEKKKEDTVPLENKASSKEAPSKEKSEKEKKKEETVPLGKKASSNQPPSKEKRKNCCSPIIVIFISITGAILLLSIQKIYHLITLKKNKRRQEQNQTFKKNVKSVFMSKKLQVERCKGFLRYKRGK